MAVTLHRLQTECVHIKSAGNGAHRFHSLRSLTGMLKEEPKMDSICCTTPCTSSIGSYISHAQGCAQAWQGFTLGGELHAAHAGVQLQNACPCCECCCAAPSRYTHHGNADNTHVFASPLEHSRRRAGERPGPCVHTRSSATRRSTSCTLPLVLLACIHST